MGMGSYTFSIAQIAERKSNIVCHLRETRMKNKIAPMLKDAKRKGVEQGLYLMAQICLVALENQVNLREVPVDDGFFKAVEMDMKHIYEEVIDSVPSGEVEEMAERLSYYVDDIRARRKMDEVEE